MKVTCVEPFVFPSIKYGTSKNLSYHTSSEMPMLFLLIHIRFLIVKVNDK